MAMELCYTSAPKGLASGTQGFCTVAATRGMPAPLIERLEALSGYRLDPRGGRESYPVNWAHRQVRCGGENYSVLSRIAFAGADYTGRSNKLAHHVALREDERPPAGPAWVLQQPDLFREAWQGEPALIPQERGVPRGEVEPAVCHAWAAAAGDAGWAGVLAEAFVLDRSKPAFVLYRAGEVDPLTLVAEALALLPPRLRWEVDFTTDYTDLPAEAPCHWRFVIDGTPAADAARKMKQGVVRIDLARAATRRPPADSYFVRLARTGEVTPPPAPEVAAPVAAAAGASAAAAGNATPEETYELKPPGNGHTKRRIALPPPPPAIETAGVAGAAAPAAGSRRWPMVFAAAGWPAAAAIGLLWLLQATPTPAPPAAVPDVAHAGEVARLQAELAERDRRIGELQRTAALGAASTRDPAASDVQPAAPDAATPGPAAVPAPSPVPAVATVAEPTPLPGVERLASLDGRFATAMPGFAGGDDLLSTAREATPLLANLSGVLQLSALPAAATGEGVPLRFEAGVGRLRFVYRGLGALGSAQDRVLGEFTLDGGELLWRWSGEPPIAEVRERRVEIERFLACSVVELRDAAGGGAVAQLQLVRPQRLGITLGEAPAAVRHAWLGAEPRLESREAPSGWRITPNGGGELTLASPAGARVELALAADGTRLRAQWAADSVPAQLASRIAALQGSIDAWSAIQHEYAPLARQRDAAAAALPKAEDGEIDLARAEDEAAADLKRWREARAKIDGLRAQHPDVELDDLQRRRDDAARELVRCRAMLADAERFTTWRCDIVARHSTSLLAQVEVRP